MSRINRSRQFSQARLEILIPKMMECNKNILDTRPYLFNSGSSPPQSTVAFSIHVITNGVVSAGALKLTVLTKPASW